MHSKLPGLNIVELQTKMAVFHQIYCHFNFTAIPNAYSVYLAYQVI